MQLAGLPGATQAELLGNPLKIYAERKPFGENVCTGTTPFSGPEGLSWFLQSITFFIVEMGPQPWRGLV
jgi:hypothetical protein